MSQVQTVEPVTAPATEAGTAPALPFTPEEWAAFQTSDLHAGGAVAGIMAAIFTIGFCIYLAIMLVAVL